MQVILGNTDVSSAVQESTYNIDSVKKYTPWTNANNVEKHSNLHTKIEGSFDMVFLAGYSMEYSAFKTLLDANTVGDVTTITLSVNNLDGATRTINCFFDMKFKPFKNTENGSNLILKRATCTVREC